MWIWMIVALVGLVLGSFVTAMSYRLVQDEPVTEPRSCCPQCRAVLSWRELVPIGSWLAQKGSCRHCGSAIHWRYPLIEAATLVMALTTYGLADWTPLGLLLLASGTVFLMMMVADVEAFILPDACQWALGGLALIWHVWQPVPWQEVWGGLALSGGLALLLHYGYYALRQRHGLGFGDVKLLAIGGFWLGLGWVPQFLLMAGLLGIVFGLLWRQWHQEMPYFPFGPALIASLWLALAMRGAGLSPFPYL